MARRIILASTSPRRKEILSKTDLVFEIVAPEYEEDMTLPLPAKELVKHLAFKKAESIAHKHKGAVIISADTFIVLGDQRLGKPKTPERAKEMLQLMRAKPHSLVSGVTVFDTATGRHTTEIVETIVYFKNYSDAEIDEYIATGEPLDKGGSYAIQGIGRKLVEKFEGDYLNIMGLPLDALIETLKKFGVSAKRIA
jgi:septum formation protein